MKNNISTTGRVTRFDVYGNASASFKLKIYRVSGSDFTLIGSSSTETIAVGLNSFSTNIALVQDGDLVGMYIDTGAMIDYANIGGIWYWQAGDIGTSAIFGWTGPGSGITSVKVYVSNDTYPENVEIDTGSDGVIDVSLRGILNGTAVWLAEIGDAASELFTFTGPGGDSSYFSIYRNSTVTYAKMNITGLENFEQDELEDSYSCTGSFRVSQPCAYSVDETLSTFAEALYGTAAYVYVNHTTLVGDTNITYKIRCWDDTGISDLDAFNVSCWNYTTSAWSQFHDKVSMDCNTGTPSIQNVSYQLSSSCLSSGSFRLRYYMYSDAGGSQQLFEDWSTAASYPNNVSVDVGDDGVIDYAGTTTLSSSVNIDLNATAIQNYLDACQTSSCSVPIDIYSVTAGIVNASNIDIRYDIENPIDLNATALNAILDSPFLLESNNTVRTGLTGAESFVTYFGYGGINLIYGLWGGEVAYGAGNAFAGYTWNGTQWIPNSSIVSGLTIGGDYPVPGAFEYGGEWWMLLGNEDATLKSMKWNGSTWLANTTMTTGLSCPSPYNTAEMNANAFMIDGTLVAFVECNVHGYSFDWSGSTWVSDQNWLYGYDDLWYGSIPKFRTVPDVFEYGGDDYMIAQESSGTYNQTRVLYKRIDSKWTKQQMHYVTGTYEWSLRSGMVTINGKTYLFDVHFDDGVLSYYIDTYELTEPDVTIRTTVTSDQYGLIGLDDYNLTWYGSKDINVTAHDDSNTILDSQLIKVRYSNYSVAYPYSSDKLMFWINYANQTNIPAIGQSYYQNGTTIAASTNWNWTMNMSVYLNQSLDSCLNLSISSTAKAVNAIPVNTTSRSMFNIGFLNTTGYNWFLNATNCNRTALGLHYFYPQYRSLCEECVASW